jgi:hypothetical protein
MKITHQTPNLLVIEQRPDISIERAYAMFSVVLVGFLAFVLVLARTLPWYATAVGLLFTAFMISTIPKEITATVCTLDKKANLLTMKRKNWFGEKEVRYDLHEIQSTEFKSSVTDAGENERVEVYEILFVLRSGSYLQLNKPTVHCNRDRTEPIFSSLKAFLNL